MDYKCIYLRLEKRSSLKINILRDRAGVARWAHNPKVGCSNHSPATTKASVFTGAFYVYAFRFYFLFDFTLWSKEME
jgi:hypothetical protein